MDHTNADSKGQVEEQKEHGHKLHNCAAVLADATQIAKGSSWWGQSWQWLEERLRCALATNNALLARLQAVEGELKASNKGARALSHALDQCERDRNTAQAEARRLRDLIRRIRDAKEQKGRARERHDKRATAWAALRDEIAAALTPTAGEQG